MESTIGFPRKEGRKETGKTEKNLVRSNSLECENSSTDEHKKFAFFSQRKISR